jgi:hypothetical protein
MAGEDARVQARGKGTARCCSCSQEHASRSNDELHEPGFVAAAVVVVGGAG